MNRGCVRQFFPVGITPLNCCSSWILADSRSYPPVRQTRKDSSRERTQLVHRGCNARKICSSAERHKRRGSGATQGDSHVLHVPELPQILQRLQAADRPTSARALRAHFEQLSFFFRPRPALPALPPNHAAGWPAAVGTAFSGSTASACSWSNRPH